MPVPCRRTRRQARARRRRRVRSFRHPAPNRTCRARPKVAAKVQSLPDESGWGHPRRGRRSVLSLRNAEELVGLQAEAPLGMFKAEPDAEFGVTGAIWSVHRLDEEVPE